MAQNLSVTPGDHQIAIGLGELPVLDRVGAPDTSPYCTRGEARSVTLPSGSRGNPWTRICSPYRANVTGASLQLVLNTSSENINLDTYPLLRTPPTLTNPDFDCKVTHEDGPPPLAPVPEESGVGRQLAPSSRCQNRVGLPTLTGRYIRSHSENWVSYELDRDYVVASGSC